MIYLLSFYISWEINGSVKKAAIQILLDGTTKNFKTVCCGGTKRAVLKADPSYNVTCHII